MFKYLTRLKIQKINFNLSSTTHYNMEIEIPTFELSFKKFPEKKKMVKYLFDELNAFSFSSARFFQIRCNCEWDKFKQNTSEHTGYENTQTMTNEHEILLLKCEIC